MKVLSNGLYIFTTDCILWQADDIFSICHLCLSCSDGSGIQGHICRESLCDGKNDCDNGEDEEEALCRSRLTSNKFANVKTK